MTEGEGVADPRVALVADEQERHMARYNTQYDGKGGIKHADHGGLWCGCGWDSGPVTGIRPWRDYQEHVAAAVLAVLDARLAQAWDEGYEYGVRDAEWPEGEDEPKDGWHPNPYPEVQP